MIRRRLSGGHAATEEPGTPAPAPADTVDQPSEPPESPETPEQLQAEAGEARQRAEQTRTQATELVTEARTAAAALVADAEARARTLGIEASAADKTAAVLEERAGYLRHATEEETRAEDAERRAGDLVTERDRLTEKIPGLDSRIAELTAEQETVATQLTEARATADVDAITELRTRTDAVADALSALTQLRTDVSERLSVIGDGQEHGELARLYAAASARRRSLRRLLNILDPDRPEAIKDRWADEFQAALRGNLERLKEQAEPQPQRQVVNLGPVR